MALYVPTVQTEYMIPQMLDDRAYGALLTSGIFDETTANVTEDGGDYVNIPTIVRAQDFSRQAVATTSAQSFDTVDAKSDKAVVRADVSGNQWYKSQLRQVDPMLGIKLSQTLGTRLAKRLAKQCFSGASAQIGAMTSNVHDWVMTAAHNGTAPGGTNTAWNGTNAAYRISIADLEAMRSCMADYRDALTHLFITSKQLNHLKLDYLKNYGVAGQTWEAVISKNELPSLLGFETVVVTDLLPITTGTTSSAGDLQYTALAFGKDAIAHSFQQNPETELSTDMEGNSQNTGAGITNADTVIYTKTTVRYLTHLKGIAIAAGMGANPTDAYFADSTKWSAAYQDHRDVRAVRLISGEGKTT